MKFSIRTSAAAVGALALALTVAACGGGDEGGATGGATSGGASGSGTVVVYTPNEQTMLDALVPEFEKASGYKVELVTAGTGELYQRIKSEVGNAQGDVMFGGGAAQAEANSELWAEYVSPDDAKMLEIGRNTSGFVTRYQADGSNLLVNTDLVGDLKIEGYEDLLDPALKGKIAFGDATQSSSAFAQLTNMLLAVGGDYESDKGWTYVEGLVAQLDGKVIGSSSQVAQDVANGEFTVALTYEPLSLSFVDAGMPVKIVYPSEGAVFLGAGAQVIKDGKNPEGAHAFLDFIISEQAQEIIAKETGGRPLRDGVDKPGVPALSEIKTLNEDNEYVAEHRDEIVKKFQTILEKYL